MHIKYQKISKKNDNKDEYIEDTVNKALDKSLEINIAMFKGIFSNDETLIIRRFQNKRLETAKCCILYFQGMVDSKTINLNIIEPVLNNNLCENISEDKLLDELQNKVIASDEVIQQTDIDEIVNSIIYGDTLFLVDGFDKALIINSKGWQTRAITEPESSKVVRGPREGFTESIIANLTMVRRKIINPKLKIQFREIGKQTATKVCVCYIEDLILNDILKELERRLDDIQIDGILDSGYIQELIRDEPFSPFETVGSSERPDVVAAKLLEGRIAVFVDGSPFVLTVPYIMTENIQSNEDYYNNYIFSSMNRILRTMAAISSISTPALYVALVTYHQEMLPTSLLLSVSASLQGVPFPTSISMFAMLIVFDLLREAGTRMPTPIGQAVNIVGTLVLGQAAVEAKLVSAPVIIVTAITGILTLLNINLIGATILIRFMMLIMASFLGIYGYIFGLIIVNLHLLSLRSFGVPYMLNQTTMMNHNGQDVWIRSPWWTMTLRPKIIGARNMVRQSSRKRRR